MVVFERQTETGSIVVTPFPGAIETKPGSATVPFFGHQSVILDAVSGKVYFGTQLAIRMGTDECDIRNWKATVLKVFLRSKPPGHPSRVPSTGTTSDILRLI